MHLSFCSPSDLPFPAELCGSCVSKILKKASSETGISVVPWFIQRYCCHLYLWVIGATFCLKISKHFTKVTNSFFGLFCKLEAAVFQTFLLSSKHSATFRENCFPLLRCCRAVWGNKNVIAPLTGIFLEEKKTRISWYLRFFHGRLQWDFSFEYSCSRLRPGQLI